MKYQLVIVRLEDTMRGQVLVELTSEAPFQPLQVGDLLAPGDWSFHAARGVLLRVIGIRHQIVGPTKPKINRAYGEVAAHTHTMWIYTQIVDRAAGTPPPSKQAVSWLTHAEDEQGVGEDWVDWQGHPERAPAGTSPGRE